MGENKESGNAVGGGEPAFLTSAPGDVAFLLRAGEGSAERRGMGPPFFRWSTEGDFGTVHTGAPSGRRQVRLGPSGTA